MILWVQTAVVKIPFIEYPNPIQRWEKNNVLFNAWDFATPSRSPSPYRRTLERNQPKRSTTNTLFSSNGAESILLQPHPLAQTITRPVVVAAHLSTPPMAKTPTSSPVRTLTRVRLTRQTAPSSTAVEGEEENNSPIEEAVAPQTTGASPVVKRPDSAVTQVLRPILDGIYGLKDEE